MVEDNRDGFPALILVAVGGCAMVAVGLTAASVVASVNVYTSDAFIVKDASWFLFSLSLPALGVGALVWGAVGILRRSVRGARSAAETLREMAGFLYLITAFLGLGHLIDPGSAMLAGGVTVAVSAALLILVYIARHLVVRCEPLMIRSEDDD